MLTGRHHAPDAPVSLAYVYIPHLTLVVRLDGESGIETCPLSWGGGYNENESIVKISSRSNEISLYCAPHTCFFIPK